MGFSRVLHLEANFDFPSVARLAAPWVGHSFKRGVAGETFNNEKLKGRVVLVEFWATWRPYCRSDVLINREGRIAGEQSGAGGKAALRSMLRKAGLESGQREDSPVELRSSPRRD